MCRGRLADRDELVDVLVQPGLLSVQGRRVDDRLGQRTAAAQTHARERSWCRGSGSTARRPGKRCRSRRTAGSCGDGAASARPRPGRRRARANRASDGCCGHGRPPHRDGARSRRRRRDRARRRAGRARPARARSRHSSARAPRRRGRGGSAAPRARRPRAPPHRSSGSGCAGAGSRPGRASACRGRVLDEHRRSGERKGRAASPAEAPIWAAGQTLGRIDREAIDHEIVDGLRLPIKRAPDGRAAARASATDSRRRRPRRRSPHRCRGSVHGTPAGRSRADRSA